MELADLVARSRIESAECRASSSFRLASLRILLPDCEAWCAAEETDFEAWYETEAPDLRADFAAASSFCFSWLVSLLKDSTASSYAFLGAALILFSASLS